MTFPQALHFWIDQFTRFVSPPPVAVEWILCCVLTLLIVISPVKLWGWLAYTTGLLRKLAARKRTAVVVCGILPIAMRVALLGIFPVSEPSIHDEFSHLLLADTLAHGRLSNPTHPMWQHFESIHIIQEPTYSSMYPPAQGIFLAVGQVLFHEPWVGVQLSVGLMFAAVCWMMQQWMSPTWALYGTLIAIARIGVIGPWVDNYLGGAVPGLAGALLIGSLPRLRETGSRAIHSIAFGLGLVILMNSRPFDGAFLGIAALIYILPSLARRIQTTGWNATKQAWAPAIILVACGFVFTGFYSWKVTGSALRMPYSVNRDTYGWPENLAFLPVRVVTSRHKVLRDMYALEVKRRQMLMKWNVFLDDKNRRVFENWAFFIGPLLTFPLLAAIGSFRDPRIRPLLLFIGLIGFLNLFQLVLYPYHLGPLVAAIFGLVAQGLRWIFQRVSSIRPSGAHVFALILPICLLLTGFMKKGADEIGLPITYWERAVEPHGMPRADIQHWLSSRSRKQLVIVRYASDHTPNQEWVYNGADIDGSKVVWAREMGDQSDATLLHYFKDREAWLLQADVWPQHVVHYRPGIVTHDTEDSLSPCNCERRSK